MSMYMDIQALILLPSSLYKYLPSSLFIQWYCPWLYNGNVSSSLTIQWYRPQNSRSSNDTAVEDDPLNSDFQHRRGMREQRKMVKVVRDMFESTGFFDLDHLTAVLLVSCSPCPTHLLLTNLAVIISRVVWVDTVKCMICSENVL